MKELKIKVRYVSVWDDDTTIVTSADLNLKTGEITGIETVDPPNHLQFCEREYIIFNDEEINVLTQDGVDGYWVRLHSGHVGPCTENYLAHRDAMSELSVTAIVNATNYIVALSKCLDDNSELLEDMDYILEPLNGVIEKLNTGVKCLHCNCGSFIYKSDLPQYDHVCPECDENF